MLAEEKINNLLALQKKWENCTRCPLSNLRQRVVFGQGNVDAKLVMLGEAPGEDEDNGGKPFVGRAGREFDNILSTVGIKRENIWVSNTCLCRPKSEKLGKSNRAPTLKEIESCFPRLKEEIDIIKPQIIVLAGNTPLYAATKKRGITKYRGWQNIKWQINGFAIVKIFATLHPASLLYGSAEQRTLKKEWLLNDWKQISEVLCGAEKEGAKTSK